MPAIPTTRIGKISQWFKRSLYNNATGYFLAKILPLDEHTYFTRYCDCCIG